ncbi:TetR/AcrR family transcriptional regulator [bacterium]|nr:TetR/AcrR family transcriptional regulator [bacterium]
MGIRERKEREREQRRGSILKEAKNLISRNGVEGTSMNQLAESTELNKATLYLYFSNKDDLIDAIVFEALEQLEKLFTLAGLEASTGLIKVMRIAEILFDFYKKHPAYFYTMNHQERRTAAERLETPYAVKGNEKAAVLFQILADCIREGMDDGSIRADVDVRSFLMLFFAHIYGVMQTMYAKADVYEDVLHLDAAIIEGSAREMIAYYVRNPSIGK